MPLIRLIARRRARALFDLCAGFVYAQVLLACVRAGLLEMLRDGPRDQAFLATRIGLSRERATRLLEAAVSLRLLARRAPAGGVPRYGLGALGTALLGEPGVAAMIAHHDMLYDDLRDPLGLLRGTVGPTRLSTFWPYSATDRPETLAGAEIDAYSELMAASQAMVAAEVLNAYRLDRHTCLLDAAGGDGGFLASAAARAPELRLMLFDLPAVAARATTRFATGGLAHRAHAIGGDIHRDPLPRGADIISFVRVIHDHDDGPALAMLRAAFQALPAGGTVLLAEPMADTGGAEPVGAAYFGFYLLAMGHGRARRPDEIAALLRAAGFARVRLLRGRNTLVARVMIAVKPNRKCKSYLTH